MQTHKQINANTQTQTNTNTNKHKQTPTQTNKQTHKQSNNHTNKQMHTHTNKHTHTHKQTNTDTYSHKNTWASVKGGKRVTAPHFYDPDAGDPVILKKGPHFTCKKGYTVIYSTQIVLREQ